MKTNLFLAGGLFAFLVMLCSSPVFAADKIKNCASGVENALENANEFITEHLNTFLATSGSFLATKYKDQIKKRWAKATLKCSNRDDYCERMGFVAFQGSGNILKYCTKETNFASRTLCSNVEVTMHELGHMVNIPIHARHNEANLYNQVSSGEADLVYRLGEQMKSYCVKHTSGSTPIFQKASRGEIGTKCKKNSDCDSNKCQGKGAVRECVCGDDDDCKGSARCKKRLGKNYCIAKGTGPGDFCKKNSDCDFGVCQKKSCVCKTDSDCKSFYKDTDNIRCVNRVGKNYCQETKQSVGQSCHKNSDCLGDAKCKKKVCSN